MKISTIASLLLISSSAGFAPSHAPPRVAGSSAPLRFGYLDTLEKESKSMERPNVGIPGEDAETIALASSLGIDDIVIRQEYGKWLARYDKSFDLTRYPQFKKNFLVQFQNDMKHGKFYTLNEFGDCNEEEFKLILSQQEAAVKESKTGKVRIIDEVKDFRRVSTQPKPIAVFAAEECARALQERFSAMATLGGDAFQKLADLVCGKPAKN